MNAQKALEIIRYEVDEEGHCGYIENELRVAMTALEKQIPKKVIFGYDEQKYVLCPICKIEIAMLDSWRDFESRVYKYCPNCGQALDWSDNE